VVIRLATHQKAVIALANKNARILWAVMTRDKHYDAHHVSVYPLPLAMRVQDLLHT
jgi:transposase